MEQEAREGRYPDERDSPHGTKNGPIANPVDRFGHLPESTRRMLEGLRGDEAAAIEALAKMPKEARDFLTSLRTEDIDQMRDAIKWQRDAKTIGKFTKWLIITIVGVFVGTVAFGEKIMVALKWIGGAKP